MMGKAENSKNNSWIHSFAVTETQTHKNGFNTYTIYKISSIVFPRAIPEALTCITVWKRFHDIKRLHRELYRRQKNLKIPGNMPIPTESTYFKRFNADVIELRKKFIINFLDFVAQHPQLYKCHIFFQFFNETLSISESPLHRIANRRMEGLEKNDISSRQTEKEITNSLVAITEQNYEKLEEHQCKDKDLPEKENVDTNLLVTSASNEIILETEKTCEGKFDYNRLLTPMASMESEDGDYIYEAALEFSRAVQAEANLEYNEAYLHYRRGVDLLLNGSKDDLNEERQFIAKTKITKYHARANDIYQNFLSTNSNDSTDSKTSSNMEVELLVEGAAIKNSSDCIERPLNQLSKYKVLRILGESVIQVRCLTDLVRSTFVIKGIEKPPSNSLTQTIFLSQHIPYMVDLLSFYQSEQKVYLILRYAEGGRLLDYMQKYELKVEKHMPLNSIFLEMDKIVGLKKECEPIEIPTETTDHSELLLSSQRLLESVSSTLKEGEMKMEVPSFLAEKNEKIIKVNKLPEASLRQWAKELFVAIQSLHEKGVILIDLHMNNLLLGDKGQLLLTYFYRNQAVNEQSYNLLAHAEHGCVAPERPLSFKSDWWSYGVILYHLLVGVSFKSMHPGHISIYGYVQYPESIEISESGRDLLNNLLMQSPDERFDADQIRSHDFFKGTNWNEVHRNGLNSSINSSQRY